MAISRASLRSSVFNDIYSVINTNVTDPLTRSKQWIFSSFPDTKSKFVGYPIVVIKKAEVEKAYPLMDNTWSDIIIPVKIIVYSTDNATTDTLSDSIDEVINDTNLPQFTFKDYSETIGDIPITTGNGGNIHYRIMTYFVEVNKL